MPDLGTIVDRTTQISAAWGQDVNNWTYRCSSIAELRTQVKSVGAKLFVVGPSALSGGLYWYDASDTTSADNGGSVIVANDGGRWKLAAQGAASVTVLQFGADPTGQTDSSAAFNAAIAASPVVRVPAGTYLITRPINMSGRRGGSAYWGKHLVGDGPATTVIYAFTGAYPCVDCTGQNTGSVSGLNFRSDTAYLTYGTSDFASIGAKMGRGAVSTGSNQVVLSDLRFNLSSIPARNSANGTIGVCIEGAEHTMMNQVQIAADSPIVAQSLLQFSVSLSSDIPTYGVEYEVPSGAQISCSVHEWRNLQLLPWDSFRSIWLWQVNGLSCTNLYTATYKLYNDIPANRETIYVSGSCANIKVDCFQETSGKFGSVYKQDHSFVTIGPGYYEDLDFVMTRAVQDFGFFEPVDAAPQLRFIDSPIISDSRFNCNYSISSYLLSGDACGFAAIPVFYTGAPTLTNLDLTVDQSGSAPRPVTPLLGLAQFSSNVQVRNFRSGSTKRLDAGGVGSNTFLPVAVGLTTAGTGTYIDIQAGYFERVGGWCNFTLAIAWSAHTGTGILAITGLPFESESTLEQAVSVSYDTLVVGAGKQLVARIAGSSTSIVLFAADPAGGAMAGVAVDGTVASLFLSGSYKITD